MKKKKRKYVKNLNILKQECFVKIHMPMINWNVSMLYFILSMY